MKFLTRSGLGILPVILIIVAIVVSLPLPFLGRQWHLFMHILGAVLVHRQYHRDSSVDDSRGTDRTA